MEFGWQLFVFSLILTVATVRAGKCIQCDSSNTNCLINPGSFTPIDCQTKCFTSVDNSGSIKRDCLGASEKCDGINCLPCDATDTACNIKKDLFWCKSCESSTDPDCAYWKNENSIQNVFCKEGVTKCLMEIKSDKHTSRRCVTNNDEVCASDRKCNTCSDGNSCNRGIFPSDRRKCYQCDSENAKCATPTKYASEITSFPCLFYEESDKCFEHGSSESSITRGCLSDTSAYGKCSSETPKDKCKECANNDCNVDEFKVAATAKCIQCKSDDAKCSGIFTTEEAKPCTTKIEYWKPQGCYTNRIEAGKVDRGCIQDFDCASASGTCTSCTSGNACNNGAQIGLSCYKCRSTDNSKCGDKLENAIYKSELCRNQTSDAADSYQCYVEKWNDIIIRSCLADAADAKTRKNCLDTKYNLCTVCKGNDCNTEKAPNSAYSKAVAGGLLVLALLALKFF